MPEYIKIEDEADDAIAQLADRIARDVQRTLRAKHERNEIDIDVIPATSVGQDWRGRAPRRRSAGSWADYYGHTTKFGTHISRDEAATVVRKPLTELLTKAVGDAVRTELSAALQRRSNGIQKR